LFTLHSPELITAEREYLLARQNAQNLSQSSVPGVASGVSSLLDSARERLAQWDIPPQEITRLETTGRVEDTSNHPIASLGLHYRTHRPSPT